MWRIAYVNGLYQPHAEASIHIEDRGYQFADGVYEVCEVLGGRLVDLGRHMARLQRSLRELRIGMPMQLPALEMVMREVARRNRVRDGLVYVQVSRGVAPRDHGFPTKSVVPSLVVTAKNLSLSKREAVAQKGIAVITVPDTRWHRVDIKTTGLLPNVLARQAAREQGANEAWFVDKNGFVTEGASCNAWIVTREGHVVTRQADEGILTGITRNVLKDTLAGLQITLEERAFTPDEAKQAAEAFVTSASQIVVPVIAIDGEPINGGQPGTVSMRLREEFRRFSEAL